MARIAVVVVVVAAIFILGGCGKPLAPSAGAATVPAAGGDSVPWADYAGSVRTQIDSAASAKDCPALQEEFNQADANNAATMTRTGHNNAALMSYIDAKMRAAGCY